MPSEFAKLDEANRKAVIKQGIREHYRQHDGQLPYNGIIKGYRLIVEQQDEVVDKIEYGLPKSSSV